MTSRMLTLDLDAVQTWLWDRIAAAGQLDLPIVGTGEWIEADDDVKLAAIACRCLAELYELDPRVIAARLAAEIALGRRRLRDASKQVARARDWRCMSNEHVRFEELQRRRNPRPDIGYGCNYTSDGKPTDSTGGAA